MAESGYALFDTPIGRLGIAWSEDRVAGVQLPESREAATRARLERRFPGARETTAPAAIRRVQGSIVALLRGEAPDLSDVALDMHRVPAFDRRVYAATRAIRPGATLSYGEIAAQVEAPGAARAVGRALARNPFAVIVPCHRVLAAGGKLGGFSASGGLATKLRLLAIEGGRAEGQAALFEGDGVLGFDSEAVVRHLRAADATLARLIDAVGPIRLERKRTPSLFAALAEAIVHQQLSTRAAETIYARLCALFPRSRLGPTAEQILRASDARLRGAGLSRAKVLALRDLASKARAGEIPTLVEAARLDDAAVVERLCAVRGVGRWTVEMLLIFRLGRPDVLPADDYGVRRGFAAAFRRRTLPTPRQLEAHGARWKPYRTAASWYLWRALEQAE